MQESEFWKDLRKDLEDPEFREAYIKETRKLQMGKSKTYLVMLLVTPYEEDDNPEEWDWATLLDLPQDDVILEDVREIEE